jgi:hypothetical protein
MFSTLADLVAPLSEEDFLGRLRERRLTYLPGAGGDKYSELLDWDTLSGVIQSGAYPDRTLRVTRNGQRVPQMFYVENKKPSGPKLSRLMEQGASVIFTPLDPYVPQLQALCDGIKRRVPERIQVSGVATTGTGGALALHYDVYDVVVVQVEGTKRWFVHQSPVVNPFRISAELTPPTELVFDNVLHPGDLLLVPAGYWHRCENGPGRSLHGAVLFEPLSALKALLLLAGRMEEEDAFKRPLIRQGDGQAFAATEEALRARLIALVGELSLADLMAAHQTPAATDGGYLSRRRP